MKKVALTFNDWLKEMSNSSWIRWTANDIYGCPAYVQGKIFGQYEPTYPSVAHVAVKGCCTLEDLERGKCPQGTTPSCFAIPSLSGFQASYQPKVAGDVAKLIWRIMGKPSTAGCDVAKRLGRLGNLQISDPALGDSSNLGALAGPGYWDLQSRASDIALVADGPDDGSHRLMLFMIAASNLSCSTIDAIGRNDERSTTRKTFEY